MAKINDTTTYPNTAPALTDHVPGTDISNTTNDANGESVTFTMQAVMDLFEANFAAPTTAITSGTFADARISESSVTQHAIASVAADTTPQLGGNLDVNGNSIVSTANADITIAPNGTGNVVLGNYTLNADATVGAGQDDFYLRYDHSTGTWGPEAVAGGGGLSNVVEDTTPQLGGPLDGQGFDLNNLGVAFLTEQAAAEVDVAGKGQIWVKSDTPNVLMFTDDAGTDATILTSESGSTLTSTTAVVAGDFVPIFDTSASGDPIQRTWTNLFSDLSIGLTSGNTYTGTHDFGGADDLEIPNSATPTVDTAGQIAIDTTVTDFSHGIMKYFSGEEMAVVAMPVAELTTPTNGAVPTYNSTTDEFEMAVPSGSGDALTTNPLSQFAATTSAQLAGVMSDETGSGALVFATSPTLVTPALGTPASGTLTNCTGLPATGLVASTSATVGFGSINLGHASDTTLARVSAGVVSIEGVNIATISATQTLTNKTLTDPKITHTVNAQTGTTYTLVLADQTKIITMSNASANTLTIPTNASVAFPTGTMIEVIMYGAGTTTVDGDTGVTVNGVSSGGATISARYTGVTIRKIGTNEWIMTGNHGTVA